MQKYNVVICANNSPVEHLPWIDSCRKHSDSIDFTVIDLTDDDWQDQLRNGKIDICLLRPPGRTELLKRLYDERVLIISSIIDLPIYPSLTEILLYENKRFVRDWLKAMSLPHPETFVFFCKEDAENFLADRINWPVVGKTNIGASGNGVQIIPDINSAVNYINDAFTKGISTRTGPKLRKGSLFKKVRKVLTQKGFLTRRLNEYSQVFLNPQKDFVIFQEFIPHTFEWRCVRIGKSFFAHKKLARNNMSSGTLLKGYDEVPVSLLNFMWEVTERTNLSSVAIDLFETERGYLINEIQCFFG